MTELDRLIGQLEAVGEKLGQQRRPTAEASWRVREAASELERLAPYPDSRLSDLARQAIAAQQHLAEAATKLEAVRDGLNEYIKLIS